ncbi:PREDICTED: zinc finger protein ZAT1-like [Camelina sativa]|uniref:Zinc finger protein ZAT1-like n=1 Tax=Camelina sativa TaxID=90675 RepID=A0ABM0YCQ1_CAMSA|nr:PREDICTED: zinc finger protein ZAT1-like [Camelina sativa]
MDEGKEKKFVCKFCYKTFPSGKALGGHIRIHSNENSVDSDRFNRVKKKRLVDQREKQQVCCRRCRKKFVSLKALRAHMVCHCEGEKMLQDSQSDTDESETSSAPLRKRSRRVMAHKHKQQFFCKICDKGFASLKAISAHMACHSEGEKMLIDSQSDTDSETSSALKRSKRVMRRSNSESFSNGSLSFDSDIDQEVGEGAYLLMVLSRGSSFKKRRNLVMNSLGESSENNSGIVETKSSSGEELKNLNVKSQVIETDDQLRYANDNGVSLCDSDGSDSDYFMNGPKKSDSDISVEGSLRNTGFGSEFINTLHRFRNSDKKGSLYELSKSKKDLCSYETDLCADTNSKIHRYRDSKSPVVKKAGGEKKTSHECPICFRVFKSGQALGGHKRSHSYENQEHNQVSEIRNQINLNVPASDIDQWNQRT